MIARCAAVMILVLASAGSALAEPAPVLTTVRADAADADWYQFLGPTRNGICEGPALLDKWPETGPKVLWKVECLPGWSGPMVKDGVVVLMERPGKKTQPDGDETIRAFDATTGKELWKVSYPCTFKGDQYVYGPAATPVGVGDKVVCQGINGKLRCLMLRTGKLVWEKDLVAEYGILTKKGTAIYDSSSSPLVVNDLVVLMCCGSVGLVALKVDDGKEVWRTETFSNYGSSPGFMWQGETPVVIAVPSYLDRKRFRGGDVLAFDGRDGQLLWTGRAGKSYYNTPVPIAAGGMVFVEGGSGDGPTCAFIPPEEGRGRATEAWKDADHQVRFSNYLGYRGLVFGQGWRAHGGPKKFWCADPATGKIHWEQEIKERYQYQWLYASDGKLIQFYDRGELVLFDADAREGIRELARAKVSDPTWSQPALCHGKMYIRTNTQLLCIDLAAR
ncbi:MAG TPA: PQQ-binding-like beta-propeller repeat protein [Planctomycetota bacterium]|nr:PQQ-binding-like beta-propeller repeat protein [Planctomycetota bacterium]